MNFPDELYYTEDHEWLRLEGDGTATVGITDFAQSELGDIVFVEYEDPGDDLDAGDTFGTVEAVKTVSDLYMPVAGTVIAVNDALDAAPEQVNEDPYGTGWLVKIRLDDPESVASLLKSSTYAELTGN
jgi:glycine cleavage system H protein